MSKTLILPTPKKFSFQSTIKSHGWYQLHPFDFDPENCILETIVNAEKPISVKIKDADNSLRIEVSDDINKKSEEKILKDVGHIFRFDEDLSEFYKLTKTEKHLTWLGKQNGGRLLRSTTVFEDLVKSICTTNCSWALTKIMVKNLVEKLGEVSSSGKNSFPKAEAMAKMPLEFYKDEIRAGYRAEYLLELAEKIMDGRLDVEKWLDKNLATPDLKKEMKTVKGVGNYAAENLLKLVGRYDGLALDSWLRGQFYKKYNEGNVCDDKQIESYYEKYGTWRGLIIWCEMSGEI